METICALSEDRPGGSSSSGVVMEAGPGICNKIYGTRSQTQGLDSLILTAPPPIIFQYSEVLNHYIWLTGVFLFFFVLELVQFAFKTMILGL